MRTIRILVVIAGLSLWGPGPAYAGSTVNNGKGKDRDIESTLSSTPLPEWPAQASALVSGAKRPDREDVALAALAYTARLHPGTMAAMVGALSLELPGSAAVIAALAVKLVPQDASAIQDAALKAAPANAEEIIRAISGGAPVKDPSTTNSQPGNRPTTPPGLAGSNKPGLIRGNRPLFPPGLVLDPKPGRDPQRRQYGSP